MNDSRHDMGYLQYTFESNAVSGFIPIQNDVQRNVFNDEPTDQLWSTTTLNRRVCKLENTMMDLHVKVTKLMLNHCKLLDLIEKQGVHVQGLLFGNMSEAEFEEHYALNYPLQTVDDVNNAEKALAVPQFYEQLKKKLITFGEYNLNFTTTIILTKLFSNKVATKLTYEGKRHIPGCSQYGQKIELQNKHLYRLILDVLMTRFLFSEEHVKVPIIGWLRNAKERNDRAERTMRRNRLNDQ